ncbi:MAG: MFS transporter [Candidatus Thermoplasmatota archaeon]|nr:MFS transporter [Candidatus Thermoplasmatota archaeon]
MFLINAFTLSVSHHMIKFGIFLALKSYFVPSGDSITTTAKLSISDGAFWAIYSSMTSTFLVPLIIFMLGKNAPIGYIIGLPVLLVPLAQFLSQKISRRVSNLKKTTIMITILDRALWIPIIFLLFVHGYVLRLVLFIVFLSLRTFFASFSGTTWTLWIPTVIPEKDRATYFSKRNFVMMLFSLVGYIFALGIFLRIPVEMISFISVFLIGTVVFSSLSLFVMSKIPDFGLEEKERVSRSSVSSIFVWFLLFIALWSFGFSMVMPYFQLYVISPAFLNLDTAFYTIIFIAVSVTAISFQLIWGRISRIYGNRNTIIISGMILIVSASTIFLIHSPILIFIPAILYGAGQSGATLSIFNEMLGRSSASRIKSISYYNLISALASAAGPSVANLIFDLSVFHIRNIFIMAVFFISLSIVLLYVSGMGTTRTPSAV